MLFLVVFVIYKSSILKKNSWLNDWVSPIGLPSGAEFPSHHAEENALIKLARNNKLNGKTITVIVAHIKNDGNIGNGMPCALCVHRTLPRLIQQYSIAKLNIAYTCINDGVVGITITSYDELIKHHKVRPSAGSRNRVRNRIKRPSL